MYTGTSGTGTLALTINSSQNATFGGTIGSGAITSTAGIAGTTGTFSGTVDVAGTIRHIGDTSTGISLEASQMTLTTSGGVSISLNNNESLYFNTGASSTQALQLDTSQNAIFAGNVSINGGGTTHALDVRADAGQYAINLNSGTSGGHSVLRIANGGGSHTGNAIQIAQSNSGKILVATATAGSSSFEIGATYNGASPDIISTGGATFAGDVKVSSANNIKVNNTTLNGITLSQKYDDTQTSKNVGNSNKTLNSFTNFVAPSNGTVMYEIQVWIDGASSKLCKIGVASNSNSSTVVVPARRVAYVDESDQVICTLKVMETGLTAGTTYSRWAFGITNSATTSAYKWGYGGTTTTDWPPLILTVMTAGF